MNLKQSNFFLLILSIISVCSCQSIQVKKWNANDLIISDQASFDSLMFPNEVSFKQAKEDISFLIYVLSTAYGGHKYISQDLLSQAFNALNAIPRNLTLSDFHDQIDAALFLIPDNHLRAYYRGRVSVKRNQYEQDNVGQVGSNNISHSEKVWEVRIDRIGHKKILYISVLKFPPHENKVWNGFMTSVATKMKSADSIIIDLRGNSGGDDTIGMQLAALLYGHAFKHPISHQYRNQSPETLALLVNKPLIQIINLKKTHEEIPDDLINEYKESQRRYLKAVKGEIPSEFIRTDKGLEQHTSGAGYKNAIYILMDKDCGSSCEFTIAAFDWYKKARKVGENTSGTFHFSNAGIAVLPHSKIKVMIPSQYSEYYDHRFFERTGIKPDLQVPAGEDAYQFVKKSLAHDLQKN